MFDSLTMRLHHVNDCGARGSACAGDMAEAQYAAGLCCKDSMSLLGVGHQGTI